MKQELTDPAPAHQAAGHQFDQKGARIRLRSSRSLPLLRTVTGLSLVSLTGRLPDQHRTDRVGAGPLFSPAGMKRRTMDKSEIKQIGAFLNDVQEGLCEDDDDTILRLYLTRLYQIIPRLMAATFATGDQGLKVLLATLEKRAREYQQEIEGRLGARN